MERRMNWAVLGTGTIACEMAQALQKMDKRLYGGGNRTHAKAVDFGRKYEEGCEARVEHLRADPDVDRVCLTTPHNAQRRCLREALKSGKHVVCEKSSA